MSGYTVYLYAGHNYGGEERVFTGDLNNLPEIMPSNIWSFRLAPGTGITLFQGLNWIGASQDFYTSVASLRGWKVGSKIGSFKLWSTALRQFDGRYLILAPNGKSLFAKNAPRHRQALIQTLEPPIDFNRLLTIRNFPAPNYKETTISIEMENIPTVNDGFESVTPPSSSSPGPLGRYDLKNVIMVEEGFGKFALRKGNKWFEQRSNGLFYKTAEHEKRAIFTLGAKIADDESRVGPLHPWEVALYEHQVYFGKVWVVNTDLPNFRVAPGLLDATTSIVLGAEAGATVFADVDYTGKQQDVVSNILNMGGNNIGDDTISAIKVWHLINPKNVNVSITSKMSTEYRSSNLIKKLEASIKKELGENEIRRPNNPPPIPPKPPVKPPPAKLEEYVVFRTALTVPANQKRVRIWTDQETILEINGQKHTTSNLKPAEFTDMGGRTTIVIKTEVKKLSAPPIYVHIDGMAANERLVIYPDQALHEFLATLNPQKLVEAKNRNGTPLFKDPETARMVGTLLNQTMGFTISGKSDLTTTPSAPIPDEIKAPEEDDQPASSGIRGNTITYSLARRQTVRSRTRPNLAPDDEQSAYSPAVRGIFDDAGDWFKKEIIEPVKKGVEVAITVIENEMIVTINKLKDFVLTAIDKISDLAEAFIEAAAGVVQDVITWVKDTWDKLLGFFNWDDVLTTQKEVKAEFETAFQSMRGMVSNASKPVTSFLTNLTSIIESPLNSAIADLSGTNAPSKSGSVEFPIPLDKLTWLTDKLFDLLGEIPIPDALKPLVGQSNDLIINFAGTIESTLTRKDGMVPRLLGIQNQLVGLFTSTDNWKRYTDKPSALIADLLIIVRDIALDGVLLVNELMEEFFRLVDALFNAIYTLLTTEFTIPVLSDVYGLVTKGQKLSLLNIGSLMVAIPLTAIRKMSGNQMRALGIRKGDIVDEKGSTTSESQANKRARKQLQVATAYITGMLDTLLDALTPPESQPALKSGLKGPDVLAEGMRTALAIVDWAADAPGEGRMQFHNTKPGDKDYEIKYWENVVYAYEGVPILVDLLTLLYGGQTTRRAEYAGIALAVIMGVVQLGLTSKLVDVRRRADARKYAADNADKMIGVFPAFGGIARIDKLVVGSSGFSLLVPVILNQAAAVSTLSTGLMAIEDM